MQSDEMMAAEGFSAHVWNNHLKSVLLLAGFPVLLALMMGAFFAGIDLLGQRGTYDLPRAAHAGWEGILRYGHFALAGAAVWFLIAFFFHGAMMRMVTGSQPITREQAPKIYNMLENLCISRGIPMPQFEVIDSPALNAFASGLGEKSFKIVLTRGIIEKLQDDELEAVIAHELTHIRNRDVRLLIISVIFVGMISFFCEMLFRSMIHGRRPNYYSRRNGKDAGGQMAVMLLGLAILAVGYLFAMLIRFALSRKREYLADAGSVELTKNPEAMMRALLRISGNDTVTGMPDDVQQMCIENSHNFMGIFATHPRIEDRISAIARTTGTQVPALSVSLRRAPTEPWENGAPPETPQSPWGRRN